MRHLAAAHNFISVLGAQVQVAGTCSRLLAQILWPQSALLVTTPPIPISLSFFFSHKISAGGRRRRCPSSAESRVCLLGFCVSASSICRQLLIAYILPAAAAVFTFTFKLRDDRAQALSYLG